MVVSRPPEVIDYIKLNNLCLKGREQRGRYDDEIVTHR